MWKVEWLQIHQTSLNFYGLQFLPRPEKGIKSLWEQLFCSPRPTTDHEAFCRSQSLCWMILDSNNEIPGKGGLGSEFIYSPTLQEPWNHESSRKFLPSS